MKAPAHGKRVFLRELNTEDAPALFEIYGCAESMRFASDPPFSSLETVYQMLNSVASLWDSKESFEWAIVEAKSNRLIGTCGLHSFSEARSRCELGCLLNRRYWGQGMMFEALQILLSHARSIGVTAVDADIDILNSRSVALFKRLGFRKESKGNYALKL